MLGFRKRPVEEGPVEKLVSEFWRVNAEIRIAQEAYNTTKDLYIECTVFDLNAKLAYRDVLLKEIRASKADWSQIIKIRGIEIERSA